MHKRVRNPIAGCHGPSTHAVNYRCTRINYRHPNVMAASCFIFKWHLIVTLAFTDAEAGLIVNKIQSFAKNPPVIGTRQYQ